MSQSTDGQNQPADGGSPHVAIGALVFAVALLAGLGLWVRFGEAVYVERILGAIANCF